MKSKVTGETSVVNLDSIILDLFSNKHGILIGAVVVYLSALAFISIVALQGDQVVFMKPYFELVADPVELRNINETCISCVGVCAHTVDAPPFVR